MVAMQRLSRSSTAGQVSGLLIDSIDSLDQVSGLEVILGDTINY
jgi:hypothetical protein